MEKTDALPAIEELIPHRGTMLLIDGMLSFQPGQSVSHYTPRAGAWYADAQGDMPAWMGIELMAQAVGAHVSLTKQREGLPRKPGVLLGTRRYESAVPAFQGAQLLTIKVSPLVSDATGLGAYDCSIADAANTQLARAHLKVYEPADFESFLKEAAP